MPPYSVGKRTVYLTGDKPEDFTVKNLAPGEVQDYVALKKECKERGTPFVDKTFDSSTMDLVQLNNEGKSPFAFKIDKLWRRPKELNKEAVFSAKDENGNRYSHFDVSQGYMGDCFYLAALSLMSDNPQLINFIIPEDNNEDQDLGIYHFRFWKHGYFFDVVVDDRLPYSESYGLSAAAQANNNEYWPLLIEKAYAKFYGSYGKIDGGFGQNALQDMTGGLMDIIHYSMGGKLTWQDFEPKGKAEVFASLSTHPGKEHNPVTGLFDSHEYAVVGREALYNKAGDLVQLLHVRNPHGKDEWKGAWSDSSSDNPQPSKEWDTISEFDKQRLLKRKEEGDFWMSIEDAGNPQYFQNAGLCYWLNDLDGSDPDAGVKYQWQEFHGEWRNSNNTSGLGSGWDAKANSPQYRVTISNVEREGEEKHVGAGLVVSIYWKDDLQEKTGNSPFPFNFFTVSEGYENVELPYKSEDFSRGHVRQSQELIQAEQDTVKWNTREFTTGTLGLKEGTYLIIPQHKPGVEGRFILRIISEGAGEIKPSPVTPSEGGKPAQPASPQRPVTGGREQNNVIPPRNPYSYQYDPYNPFNLNDIPFYNNWDNNGGFQYITYG